MAEAQSPAELEGVHPGSVDLSAHDAGAPSAGLNRENVAKVRDVIAAHDPSRFDMGAWAEQVHTNLDVEPTELLHNCETAGCIGGWTQALFETEADHQTASAARASKFLGLPEHEGETLFYVYGCAKDMDDVTQAHAVAVLDILLETGEVDWGAAFERVAQAEAVAK